MEALMTASIRSTLYRSAIIQQKIEAEQRRQQPDWLQLMRLKRLRLLLTERLHAATGEALNSLRPRKAAAC
jgi:hypothetical protein